MIFIFIPCPLVFYIISNNRYYSYNFAKEDCAFSRISLFTQTSNEPPRSQAQHLESSYHNHHAVQFSVVQK